MVQVFRNKVVVSLTLVMAAAVARADFSYQQTLQITGGSVLKSMQSLGAFSSAARKIGDPQVSTIYLKGNRMAMVSEESMTIYDLDKETITHVDLKRRTWNVVTFEQMRQNMERIQGHAAHATTPENDTAQGSFNVKVRTTGAKKTVSDLPTSEAIMTMVATVTNTATQQSSAMAITNDMWMAPEVAGYAEMRAYQIKLSQKMAQGMMPGGMDFTSALMSNPKAMKGLADLVEEMRKLKGVPVQQVMRLGSTPDGKPLPAASEAPLPQEQGTTAGSAAKQGAVSTLAGRLPFGGLGKKKNDDDAQANQNAAQSGPAVMMETQTTLSNFSTSPVDESHFAVPAGFKQINAPGMR